MTSQKDLKGAVGNIISAKDIARLRNLGGFIFSFSSLSPDKAFEVLKKFKGDGPNRPTAVILFDKGVVIHQKEIDDWRFSGNDSEYEIRQCEGKNPSAGSLTYLLLVFLCIQIRFSGDPSDLMMAISKFLKERTVIS